jgi:hypothetical protein
MEQPHYPAYLDPIFLNCCAQPFLRLHVFPPLLDLVEYPYHNFFAGLKHDDRYRFHQITSILTLLLPALPVPGPPVVVYGLLRMVYRL